MVSHAASMGIICSSIVIIASLGIGYTLGSYTATTVSPASHQSLQVSSQSKLILFHEQKSTKQAKKVTESRESDYETESDSDNEVDEDLSKITAQNNEPCKLVSSLAPLSCFR